jgi:hypothetical protein
MGNATGIQEGGIGDGEDGYVGANAKGKGDH